MGIEVHVPYALSAEEGLLGAVLIDPEQATISLSPDAFYIHRHRWIWEAYQCLLRKQEQIDIVTVAEELDRMGKLKELGGSAYLTKLASGVPSSLNAESYAGIIEETYKRRQLLSEANRLSVLAYDEKRPINEIVALAIRELDRLSTVSGAGRTLAEAASDAMDTILSNNEKMHRREKIDYGLQTGIRKIDDLFKGLKPGWLVYLAGSPGVGKSMLALQWAMVFGKQAPGCYIALEMDEASLMYRAYSMKVGRAPTEVEFGEVDPSAVVKAYEQMEPLPVDLFVTPRLSVQELKAYIAKKKADNHISWVILDYVSLVDVPRTADKIADDEYLSEELRKIAGEYAVTLIGLDSVTKVGASGYMTLDAIRGSFTKQHDADISFGYSVYQDKAKEYGERARNMRALGVLKDRHRGNGGRMMVLEYADGLIDAVREDEPFVAEDWSK